MGKARSILALALVGAAGTVIPTACDSESTTVLDSAQDPALAEQGQVQLSLVGVSSSGTAYRLRQAIIVVQGPSSTLFLDSDLEPESTSLGATVPAGFYTAFLQEGWSLERISGPVGTPLSATLLSPNPMSFVVDSGQSTRVPLRFAVGGETIDVGSFDIVLEVEEQGGVSAICSISADCPAGQTCCPGGFLGTCQALAPGASCALPDLTVDAETARSSMFFSFQDFPPGSCALEEGCVDGPGLRRLLSFATQTANIGGSDIVLGDPEGVEGFEFAACHGHYHFEGYAEYQLLEADTGRVAARGHKQAFCLLDTAPVGIPGAPTSPRFHCNFQGIQRGWSDVYGAGLDCQWVDITDVSPGQYTLRIHINPEGVIEEADYTNNTAEIAVTIGDSSPLTACASPEFGPFRDCGWSFAGKMRGLTCEPGQLITLGCGACSPGSVCEGVPVLRVCEGTEACVSFEAIALGGSSCDQCLRTQFFCPASGVYSVLSGAGDSSQSAVCQPTVQAQGPFGLLDPCPFSGPGRDCGWTVDEGFNALGCVPGQETTFSCGGCSNGIGGSCSGDPMIRVCAGNEPCTFTEALVSNDDSCGLCSEARFTCPSDGVYTVMTGPFGGGTFTCEPTRSPLPPPPPPPPPPASSDAGAP